MVITVECTATFSDLWCSPEFGYYKDVNMPIKVCSEAYFFRLEILRFQTRDPQLKVPPGGLVLRIFTS